jgi:type I restriction-modification system DNA methylase subunit
MSNANLSSFVWPAADLLPGDSKQSNCGEVILPFTVLRRLDCVLEGTRNWQAELSLADLRAIALMFIELIECHVEAA